MELKNEAIATKAQAKIFALVRDKNGKPKVDDVDNCAPEILAMLTKKEIEDLKNGC